MLRPTRFPRITGGLVLGMLCLGLSAAAPPGPVWSVENATMQRIYERVETPFKYGIVLRGAEQEKIDCPNVFRHGGKWWMFYIAFGGRGYETRLAVRARLKNDE